MIISLSSATMAMMLSCAPDTIISISNYFCNSGVRLFYCVHSSYEAESPSWCHVHFFLSVCIDFLGCTKLALKDLLSGGDCPWTKRLLLEDVKKGEIELKIELELNKSDLLL